MKEYKLFRSPAKFSSADGTRRIWAPKLRPIQRKDPKDRSLRWLKNYASQILTTYKLTPELHHRLSAARRYQSNVSHAIQRGTLIALIDELRHNNLSTYPLRNKRITTLSTQQIFVVAGLFDDE
jgi:hypothetical protein